MEPDPNAPIRLDHGHPVSPDLTSILDDIPGYGSNTIGGRDGTIYVVTNLNNEGPGSLRVALESEDPLWIVFDEGLNGSIPMERTIYARSFKTVDARGHQITLEGVQASDAEDMSDGWHDTGISLGRPHDRNTVIRDVIFLNLTFDGRWPHPNEGGDGSDGLHLHNQVSNVWVHQCTFHNWIDGGIDARNDSDYEEMPEDITITNSHFYDIDEGLLLEARRLTFAQNVCERIGSRCIKAIDGARAHMVNNVIKAWRSSEIVYARGDSKILVDHNIFRPVNGSSHAGRASNGGRLQSVHNVRYGGHSYRVNDAHGVGDGFKSEAQDAYGHDRKINCEHDPVDWDCWEELYEEIRSRAGAHPDN